MDLFVDTITGGIGLFGSLAVLVVLLLGTLWGTAAGALPGMTSTLAIGVMVPFTFVMEPIEAVAFLVAINVGVSYGNSIPAILVGLPGTPSAVLTALDGYQLHKRGESGLALGASFFAAVSGQGLSTFFFVAMVVPLGQLAYSFLTPEIFAMHLLGVTALISLTGKNVAKGLLAAGVGLFIAMIGTDPVNLVPRFTLGMSNLRIGIEIVPVVIGVLAVSELLRGFRQVFSWGDLTASFKANFPSLEKLRKMLPATLGGTIIGTLIGAIPGVGGSAAAVISYQQAKLVSKTPEEFGKGSVSGIAANESAQQGSQAGELVPTFGFGIPGSGAMVLLLGALTLHGIVPGPLLVRESPELLQAVVAGLLGATLILAIIGWPITRALLRVATLNRSVVLTVAFCLTLVGVFALNRSLFDVLVLLIAGLVGYVMLRYGYSTAAAAIAVVLGAGLERSLRQGILLEDRSFIDFVSRPITATVLILVIALLLYGIRQNIVARRREQAIYTVTPNDGI